MRSILMCLIVLISVVGMVYAATVEAAPAYKNGVCTLDVPVTTTVEAAAAGRSVGCVAKAVVAPVKAIGRIASTVKNRERKPSLKVVKAVGGRPTCPLRCRRCNE